MTTALLVIDMQQEMANRMAAGRAVADPKALARMADLIALFRARGLAVVHVHHNQPGGPFDISLPSGAAMAELGPAAGEAVFLKSGSSGFSGTGLEQHLRGAGITRVVIIGAVAAFCVTSTVRAASDLGYRVILPGDALLGFGLADTDGAVIDAATIHRVTLAVLAADFATVVTTDQVAGLLAA